MPLRWIEGHEQRFLNWCQAIGGSAHPADQRAVQQMLDLHDELEVHPLAERAWFYSTRHTPLGLTPAPQQGPGVHVRISGMASVIEISYALPPGEAPWPAALVVGWAEDSEAAIPMIAAAFERIAATYDAFPPPPQDMWSE